MDIFDKAQFAQMGLFIVVGALNTLVDFTIYNLLTGKIFRWPRIRSNLVSTTVAMGFSFTANVLLVFPPEKFSVLERSLKFVVMTAFSLYVVQSVVIYLWTNVWRFPVSALVAIAKRLSWMKNWNEDVISRNMVKILATGFSLVWNFLWYKFYVFR